MSIRQVKVHSRKVWQTTMGVATASILILLVIVSVADAECAWVLWEYNPSKQNPSGSPVPVAAFAEGDGTCKLQMVEQMRAAPEAGRYWLCFPDTVDPRK
jgi:hypothetical protein